MSEEMIKTKAETDIVTDYEKLRLHHYQSSLLLGKKRKEKKRNIPIRKRKWV